MILSLVAALAENGVIGRGQALPWHLPADLARFKRLTMGHAVIVGRRTFQAIGRVLPGRRWVVLSADPAFQPAGVEVARDFEAALAAVRGDAEVFVAGGAAVYAQALPRADRLYLTVVHAVVPGDTRFPAFRDAEWRLVEDQLHRPDPRHAFAFSFRTYHRIARAIEPAS